MQTTSALRRTGLQLTDWFVRRSRRRAGEPISVAYIYTLLPQGDAIDSHDVYLSEADAMGEAREHLQRCPGVDITGYTWEKAADNLPPLLQLDGHNGVASMLLMGPLPVKEVRAYTVRLGVKHSSGSLISLERSCYDARKRAHPERRWKGTDMATKTVRTDDLDGSIATRTVTITLDGTRFTLDLNDEHAVEFENAAGPWLKLAAAKKERAAAKPKKQTELIPTKAVPTMADGSPIDKEAARAWAKANGVKVGDFFINPAVLQQYADAVNANTEQESQPESE
jgi:hypothetical protein